MANMAYCRFQNTLNDLRDCLNHIDDVDLDEEENQARERLIRLCREIADSAGDDE